MEACYKVAQELYAEFSAKSPEFKKIYDPWSQFRDDQYLWFRWRRTRSTISSTRSEAK